MTYLLEMEGISKRFPGVKALDSVDLKLAGGSVHALVGKNGAGKSTLIKILSGAIQPDSGRILIQGQERTFFDPAAAMREGVAVVHQELSLVQGLSVAENIFLGRWVRGRARIDWTAMRRGAREYLSDLDPGIEPDVLVGQLGIAQQQLVEIAKALSHGPRVLVLDEPTSALSEADAQRLLRIVGDLARTGVGVIYISHRLGEIEAIADHVTVLRDGRSVASNRMSGFDRKSIVSLMLGSELAQVPATESPVRGDIALSVRNISSGNTLKDISFDLHKGEILGIAGLVGAGRSELARAIFGVDPIDRGTITLAGRRMNNANPRRMRKAGLALLPEDRKRQGLFLDLPVSENMLLAILERFRRGLSRDRARERELVNAMVRDLQIVCANTGVAVRTLSGGNQQKIIIGKWLAIRPSVLILDEPTRGIDVHAKAMIFRLLGELARQGLAIIFISSELEEVLLVSHRVLTMARGRIVADQPVAETDLSGILLAAAA